MNDKWNAFLNKEIIAEPTNHGVLSGKTFALKDVFDVKGHTASAGNPYWLHTHEQASDHAEAVKSLLASGAKLTGVTHTDELMYGLNGENFHYGTPLHPINHNRIPGGSSSGSAVAVAAGLVDFAIGTDTGGSIRIPASYCGVYGFRPTHGSLSVKGLIPLAPSFDTVGFMAKDINTMVDVASVLFAFQATAPSFENVVGVNNLFELTDEEACKKVEILLEDHAVSYKNLQLSYKLSECMEAFRTLQGIEIWRAHGEWIKRYNPTFGPDVAERFEWASTLKEEDMSDAKQIRDTITKELTHLLDGQTILVLPTAPGVAPLKNAVGPELQNRRLYTLQMTCLAGLAGLPQLTIPAGYVNQLPVGLSVIAGRNQDQQLVKWVQAWMGSKERVSLKE
ncbi:amidase [Priestia flexa]|uniref:Amidase n=1 Tax=Priestia veravalensis TaxID=1414648 RepID=A0A0V8JNK7_9BACI|nr:MULTISPECIES: amidase [Priestia]KSU88643.1 amidase [Priestia veravalensis]SCC07197.1 amidase [Priestia flexa]